MLGRIVDLVCGRFLLWPVWGFVFRVFCFSPLSLWMIVTIGWLWCFPFGSAGLQLKIRLWFSDTRAGCESSCERSFLCPATPHESAVRVLFAFFVFFLRVP